jgi:zinc/manganese transport system permease protein
VQIVGALLVLSLLITPAAAAAQLTASPLRATLLSVLFAEIAAVGGILLSLAPGVPVSTFITTISFVIYLACRFIGRPILQARRRRALRTPAPAATPAPDPAPHIDASNDPDSRRNRAEEQLPVRG